MDNIKRPSTSGGNVATSTTASSGPLSRGFSISNNLKRPSSSAGAGRGGGGPLSRGFSIASMSLNTPSLHRATSSLALTLPKTSLHRGTSTGTSSSRNHGSSILGAKPTMLESLRAEMADKRDFFAKESSFYREGNPLNKGRRRFSNISEQEGGGSCDSMGLAEVEGEGNLNNKENSSSHFKDGSYLGESHSASIFFAEQAARKYAGEDENVVKRKLSRAKAFHKAIRKSRYKKKAQGLVTSPATKTIRQFRRLKRYFLNHRHELRAPIFLCLWICWLLIGTLFYGLAPKSNLGMTRGFYMALNIGYSIGFGYPSEDNNSYLFFSTWYVLCGASFVGAALGFFAEKVSKDNEDWFTRLEQKKEIEESLLDNKLIFKGRVKAWFYHYAPAIRALSVWSFFVISMVVYSMAYIKWSIREALYFAISSLSTGGHWTIPNDSPDWLFGLTGLFIMFGVPMMAVAMAQTAYVFISNVDIDEAKATINAVVTKEEIEYLHELGMDEFDGTVDRAEFIILCMVRMGTDPGLIAYVNQRFMELGFYTGEPLRVKEITQGAHVFFDGRIRRRASINITETQSYSEYEATLMSLREHDTDTDTEVFDSVRTISTNMSLKRKSSLRRPGSSSFRRSVSFEDNSDTGFRKHQPGGKGSKSSLRRSVSFEDDSDTDFRKHRSSTVSMQDESFASFHDESFHDEESCRDNNTSSFRIMQPFVGSSQENLCDTSIDEDIEEEEDIEDDDIECGSSESLKRNEISTNLNTTKLDLVAESSTNMSTTKLDLVADCGGAKKQSARVKGNEAEPQIRNSADSSFLKGLLEKFRSPNDSSNHSDVTSTGDAFCDEEVETTHNSSTALSQLLSNLQGGSVPLGLTNSPTRSCYGTEHDPPFVQSAESKDPGNGCSLKGDFPLPNHSMAIPRLANPTPDGPAKLTLETTVISECHSFPPEFMGRNHSHNGDQRDLQSCTIYKETLRIQPPLSPPPPSIRDTQQDAKDSEPTNNEDHRNKQETFAPPKSSTSLPMHSSSPLVSPALALYNEERTPEGGRSPKKKNYARYLYSPLS